MGFLKHQGVLHPASPRLLDDSTLKQHKHDITGTGMDTSVAGWATRAVIKRRGPGFPPTIMKVAQGYFHRKIEQK